MQNIRYIDGYFVFYMGKCSVCHFELKEVPDWCFGIWLEKDGFKIFGEHQDLIDKFKPSRTYVSYQNDMEAFIHQVKAIQKNPKLYFVDSLTGVALFPYNEKRLDDGDIYCTGYQVVRKFNERKQCWEYERDSSITQEEFVETHYAQFIEEKLHKKQLAEKDRKLVFSFLKELPNQFDEIQAIGLVDCNKNGWICSPRYDVRVVVLPSVTKNELTELDQKVREWVWEKNHDERKQTLEHDFQVFDYSKDLSILKHCDYRFYSTMTNTNQKK